MKWLLFLHFGVCDLCVTQGVWALLCQQIWLNFRALALHINDCVSMCATVWVWTFHRTKWPPSDWWVKHANAPNVDHQTSAGKTITLRGIKGIAGEFILFFCCCWKILLKASQMGTTEQISLRQWLIIFLYIMQKYLCVCGDQTYTTIKTYRISLFFLFFYRLLNCS